MAQERKFGEGQPVFEKLIKQNRVYVDKTALVYKMTQDYSFVFLSRPRRFGKSLLCSTLKSYFEGKKDLFKGLAIEKLEKDWTKYPILHFELGGAKNLDKDALESYLSDILSGYEEKYNITPKTPYCNIRLSNLIKTAHAQENQEVVLIIDEYDAPLLEVVHDDEKLPLIRQIMRNFYSPIKSCAEYLHFVFITGITKFSQLSIFSELNNLKNISLMPEYAAICGITEEELLSQLSPDIDNMAKALGETREQTISGLKNMYDGYHFCWPSPDVYNPYSLINALSDKDRNPFWLETGTPAYIVEMLRKFSILPQEIGGVTAFVADFNAPTENITDITPLLYQSGYLTIKDYDLDSKIYTLDIPNEEVQIGLANSLLPHYIKPIRNKKENNISYVLGTMNACIKKDNMDGALKLIKDFLAGVPYPTFPSGTKHSIPTLADAAIPGPAPSDATSAPAPTKDLPHYEGHYQQLLYVIFSFLGCRTDSEVRTAKGRIDLVLETATRIYVIELKMNKNVQSALAQIDKKQYPAKYSPHPLPVYKLAITFNVNTRTLDSWRLEMA